MNATSPPAVDQVLPWIRNLGERLTVVFKTSPACGTSRQARRQFEAYVQTAADVAADYFIVDVLAQRPLSRAIAEASGVRHESPQVLLLKNGMCVWHTSHISISEETLRRQIGRFSAPAPETPANSTTTPA